MAPTPSLAESRANHTFDALLWALSRPGQVRALPELGEAPVVEALMDRECTGNAADPRLMPVILRTGAEIQPLETADYVFMDTCTDAALLTQVKRGSDLYPDDAATVVVRAQFGKGPALRLTGPGVDREIVVQIDGLPDGFWQARADSIRYPMGPDIFLLDGARVIGVPRTTEIEVL